tara:strand:- start:552 stop:881 length:330 start_codon:yes stop_codon:yes gene_type:complete
MVSNGYSLLHFASYIGDLMNKKQKAAKRKGRKNQQRLKAINQASLLKVKKKPVKVEKKLVEEVADKKVATKKAPAKKTAVKKAPAKKAATKKATSKKAAAKKTTSKAKK